MGTTDNYRLCEKNPSHDLSRFQLVFLFLLNPAEKKSIDIGVWETGLRIT